MAPGRYLPVEKCRLDTLLAFKRAWPCWVHKVEKSSQTVLLNHVTMTAELIDTAFQHFNGGEQGLLNTQSWLIYTVGYCFLSLFVLLTAYVSTVEYNRRFILSFS